MLTWSTISLKVMSLRRPGSFAVVFGARGRVIFGCRGLCDGLGPGWCARCARVGAGSTGRPGWCCSSGRGACSAGEGEESFVGGGQIACPLPAGWDLQDLAAGVGDEAGWGAQEPVAQRFGFGFGEFGVEGEVAQPG